MYYGLVPNNTLERVKYGYILVVPVNERVLKNPSNEQLLSGHK